MEARQVTNDLLQAIEDGFVDKDTVLMACLKYMSEDDVKDMCKANNFNIVVDEEDEWDELAYNLDKRFESAALYDEDDEHYVEIRFEEEIDSVRDYLTDLSYVITKEDDCCGSDYEAYYIWIS